MLSESRTSDPVTRWPAPRNRRAMPLMPEPPMPTKCTAPSSAGIWAERSGLMVTWASPRMRLVCRRVVGSTLHRSPGRTRLRPPRGCSWRGVDEGDHAVGAVEGADGCRGARHVRRVARIGEQGNELARTHSGGKSASSTRTPPPASTTSAALKRCSPLPTDTARRRPGCRARRVRSRWRRRRATRRRRRPRARGPCGRRTRPCGSREAGSVDVGARP